MNQDSTRRPGAAESEQPANGAADEQETHPESMAPEPAQTADQESPEPAPVGQDIAALEAELTALRAKVDSHWDKLLRSNADLDNLRKRNERDLENAHRYALERFVAELLPVKDSMELGLSAARDESNDRAGILEGFELTLKMFSSALEKFDVVEVNPEGEAFNPELHQAMTLQEAKGVAAGTVVTVVQKGYLLSQRLVRPALVIVSK